MHTELNRRDVLKTIGGAGLAAVFGARALDFLGDDAQAATTCLLTPEVTEGPYWVDTSLTRRDVRSGKAGLPLVLRFASTATAGSPVSGSTARGSAVAVLLSEGFIVAAPLDRGSRRRCRRPGSR